MKTRILLIIASIIPAYLTFAQDTIRYVNGNIMIGQVEEIQRDMVRFRTASAGNSVVISAEKKDLQWVHLAGGQQFKFGTEAVNDSLSKRFLKRLNIVSFDLFAPALDHVTLGYERMLNPGTSLVFKVGKIGVWNTGGDGQALVNQGVLFKLGTRLMLPKSLPHNAGLHGRHPLVGWYLRPEVMFSYWVNTEFQDLYSHIGYPYMEQRNVRKFLSSAAVNLVFGGQFFIGDRVCVDIYTGMGYGLSWRNGVVQSDVRNYSDRANYSFSHAFFTSGSPLCVSGGALLGYAF